MCSLLFFGDKTVWHLVIISGGVHVPNESGLMSEFRAISKIKSADSLWFNQWLAEVCGKSKGLRWNTHTHTHIYVQTETCTLQHARATYTVKTTINSECFSFEFAVKASCVTVRAAGFPDGCVWMLSVRWILGLHACYDYDIINTHSKWEWEQTWLGWTGRGLFINKMHSLKLCSLLWLIRPAETEPGRPLLWPWHCPG